VTFGLVVGGLAVLWGVLVALLDQPTPPDQRQTSRFCTALLVACAAATAGGVLATLTGH
jgi:hypothetical protein